MSEVVDGSGGQAHVLTTNRNLLIIADVLIVHRGFAQEQPKIVEGLVQGLLEGNRMVRDRPDQYLDVIGRAFKWSRDDTKGELANVHLSNLPENLAFFSGAIDAAGSFEGIYQSAVLAYGSDLIKDPPDASRFARPRGARRRSRRAASSRTRRSRSRRSASAGGASLETDPLLSKDIRFLFEPNSSTLDMANQENIKNLEAIKRLLQVSPGSTLLLRGHVDNAHGRRVPQAGRRGLRAHAGAARDGAQQGSRGGDPQAARREATASTPSASTSSAAAGKNPSGPNSDLNRRVEVQWFTIE